MITIISGTNREKNETIRVSKYYAKKLSALGIENQVLDLQDLPNDFLFSGLYGKKNEAFTSIVEKYVLNADKLVIVSPEYNGSFPGILKAFIEGWDPKRTPEKWAALVGVAAGRQGNSRGMDDLTNVLNYLQINVIPVKIPISQIYKHFNNEGDMEDEELNKLLEKQIGLIDKK